MIDQAGGVLNDEDNRIFMGGIPFTMTEAQVREICEAFGKLKQFNLIKHSEFDDSDSCLSLPLYKRKKYVIIGSRVHPGESNGSYMMQGLIKYLLGDSHQAKQLRKRVVFKIIPMSNPDGVIAGNYRTSMSGHDLNRRYHEPDSRLHPTVCAIK